MYQDHRPCEECGSEVRVRGRTDTDHGRPEDGRNEADDTVDQRVCTNPECPTNRGD